MRIKAIGTPTPWESKYGTMYQALITLEDGREGQVNMKVPSTWKVGDEIEILDEASNPHGITKKWKITKAQAAPAKDGMQKRIDASWAIGQAIALGMRLPEEIEQAAKTLLQQRDKLMNEQ